MGKKHPYTAKDVCKFLCNRNHRHTTGVLSDKDFEKAILDREIFIYPMNRECITPIGYNFCPSEIIISTRTGLPIDIFNKKGKKYAIIAPHDTVLVSTKEYVAVSKNIMGTFHSKVKIVSGGFGHISTTMDPGWKGPLLIALNNPTSKKLHLVLSDNGKPEPFVTLVFYRFCHSAYRQHDNPPYRTDILEKYLVKPSYLKKVILGKTYENYDNMVKLIGNSMDLSNITNESDSILSKLEATIIDIKNSYLSGEEENRGIIVEELFRNIEQGEQLQEFSWDLSALLRYLQCSMKYFCLQGKIWPDGKRDFEEVLLSYLELCIRRLQDEKIGKYWAKRYDEIRELSTVHKHRLKLVLGIRWRKILLVVFIAIILGGLLVLWGHLGNKEILENMLAPALIALATSIIVHIIEVNK